MSEYDAIDFLIKKLQLTYILKSYHKSDIINLSDRVISRARQRGTREMLYDSNVSKRYYVAQEKSDSQFEPVCAFCITVTEAAVAK